MSYENDLTKKLELEKVLVSASEELSKFPKNEIGLTPDEIKFSPEYKKAKSKVDAAFQNLRKFNGPFVKKYKKEIIKTRNEKRAAK